MDPKPDDPVLPFADRAAFERWLAKHHRTATAVWVKYAKKASGEPSISAVEAVEVALCYGWIDGQAKPLDERHYLGRFTPRRAASTWSKINRDRVARLIAAGKMRPAGQAEIDRAQADGRWDAAYDSPSTATVPDDLARALATAPGATAAFAALPSMKRFSILYRLQTAKRAETRARHIEAAVAMVSAAGPAPAARRSRAAPRSGGRTRG